MASIAVIACILLNHVHKFYFSLAAFEVSSSLFGDSSLEDGGKRISSVLESGAVSQISVRIVYTCFSGHDYFTT